MRPRKRNWAIFWLIVVVLIVGAVVFFSGLLDPEYKTSSVDQPGQDMTEVVVRGKYLLHAADCIACHTAPDGAPLAGGLPLATPFGTIYATNITPDKQYGIGSWTSADFYRALHDGVTPSHSLYPAMPYTSYRGLKREDTDAIYAYLQTVRPVAVPNRENGVSFPFDMRFLVRGWNLLFLRNTLPAASEGSSDAWVRGRYLTNALGHCTECHTPRGALGQMKLGETFRGGSLGEFNAPDITPQGLAARGWTVQGLQQFLATGLAPQSSAYGEMYLAFFHSTKYLTESDNHAMVRYLTGDADYASNTLAVSAQSAAGAGQVVQTGQGKTSQGQMLASGRSSYLALCAGCHGAQGQGKPDVTVMLQGNTTVRNVDSHNLIRVVLDGLEARDFTDLQSRQQMPGFADRLNDGELAGLANYLRSTWGGQKADVQASDVASLRQSN